MHLGYSNCCQGRFVEPFETLKQLLYYPNPVSGLISQNFVGPGDELNREFFAILLLGFLLLFPSSFT
jgi:hypothetical protein